MEFSPDVYKGEASEPPGGFSVALCFPLSRRLEALDLVLTILLDSIPTDGAKLFQK